MPTLKYLFAALVIFVQLLHASDAHALGGRRKKGITLESADFTFGEAQFNGDCAGTGTAFGNAVVVNYDGSMEVKAGQAFGALAQSKRCVVEIPIDVPAGQQLIVATSDLRGSYNGVQGTGGSLAVRYSLKSSKESIEGSASKLDLRRLKDTEFTHSAEAKFASRCGGRGQRVRLVIESRLQVATNQHGDQVIASLDTADLASKAGVTASVQKVACR